MLAIEHQGGPLLARRAQWWSHFARTHTRKHTEALADITPRSERRVSSNEGARKESVVRVPSDRLDGEWSGRQAGRLEAMNDDDSGDTEAASKRKRRGTSARCRHVSAALLD